ncbi:MAG: hypothetical protein ACR2PI_11695 [Hyphomicrobiaceae bacterium]
MGGLAHVIESAGIATTQISLIRLHTEKLSPPRALWVPFELGRPMGEPDDAAFQHRVLAATLDLLDRDTGPVIADYPEEAGGTTDDGMEGWVCPMPARASPNAAEDPAATLLAEIASLRQWHDLFQERRGRTTVGACPVEVEDIARGLVAMLDGSTDAGRIGGLDPAQFVKLGSEDIKAFYTEAALAMPGSKSSQEIADWLWGETELARVLFALKNTCIESDDPKLQTVGNVVLVPRSQQHRESNVLSEQRFSSMS